MYKFLAAFLILFLSVESHAIRDNEFFWQADKKEFYFITTATITSLKATYKAQADSYVKRSGTNFFIGGEYGLNKNVSVSLGTSYRHEERKYTPGSKYDYDGLGDVDFGLKGTKSLESGYFRYGLSYSLSMGDTVYKSGNQNNYSGRDTIVPYVGFDTDSGKVTLGGLLGYQFYFTNQKIKVDNVRDEVSGGEAIFATFFVERALRDVGNLGTKIQYAIVDDTTLKSTGEVSKGGYQVYIAAYGNGDYKESITIHYQLGYSYAEETEELSSTRGFIGYVGFRFKF